MPFKPGKSISDAAERSIESLRTQAAEQVKNQLGAYLTDEELEQITVKYTEDDRVLVNGPDHIMDKIKQHQETK